MLSAALFCNKKLSSLKKTKTKMRTVLQINKRLWHVRTQLKSGCKPGKAAPRKLHSDEVDNLVFEEDFLQVERDLANFKAARLAREAEQAKREEEIDQSFLSMQAHNGAQEVCVLSDLDKASTADLLSLQSKLQAAEGNVKVFLRLKQNQTMSQTLKEREETKIRNSKREISSIKTRGAQRRTTSSSSSSLCSLISFHCSVAFTY